MIRIGLLGAARIAPRAIIDPVRARKDAEVVCVAARDAERARHYANEHAIPDAAADYAALLARDDIDLVYVALPAARHAEWCVKASEAGKAVLCEKPFAMNAAEARTMVEAAERAGRPLLEAFHYRHHPVMHDALRLIHAGEIGRLVEGEADFNMPIPFRPQELRWQPHLGGGALMDLGCYPLHALRVAAREEPQVAWASMTMARGVDEATEAELVFPSGFRAGLKCSMAPGDFSARLFIRGETGSVEITNYMAPQLGCRLIVTRGDQGEEHLPLAPGTTFAWQFDHMVEVLAGRAAPLTGGADAVATMVAIDAIRAAATVAA